MLIDSRIIQDSIERARRNKLDPEALSGSIGDGDRSKRVQLPQREARYRTLLADLGDARAARTTLERVLGGNDLVSINYLARGMNMARAICRVHLRSASGQTLGFGTGFLIAPGVLMTNHHVISGEADARNAFAEFDYELDVDGNKKDLVEFEILTNPAPIALERLDFCLVAVAPRSRDSRRSLSDYGWLPLDPTPGKAFIGEYLTIVQHPGGERKQVCVRENQLLLFDANRDTLWYKTDTVAGSSGSPVFNNAWQVCALHHSGIPKTDGQGRWLTVDGSVWDRSMDESQIDWIANEGVRISSILSYLSATAPQHPLAAATLAPPKPSSAPIERSVNSVTTDGLYRSEQIDGELRVSIPVQIAVRVGQPPLAATAAAPAAAVPASLGATVPASDALLVEKVDIDQSNYAARKGYNPAFLGGGTLQVPLPEMTAALKNVLIKRREGSKSVTELKYWNYSVFMHKRRRLAIVSAVNVDTNKRPDLGNREGDRWYFDTRISEENQIGQEFYGEQRSFEAKRDSSPFDRGHLTRRMDATWGSNAATAKRNGDDSFHFTNCAPQHWQYNQGAKRWLGLEDYVIENFARETGIASVFNGPVFDAPLSVEGPDGRLVPDIKGERHSDPTFGDVAIPKLFFKIVVCARDRQLAAAAFLMTQEDFLASIDRLHGMEGLREKLTSAEARLYQVSLTTISRLTGLSFPALKGAEVELAESLQTFGPRRIEQLSDLRL
ncbi:MAG: DNA/RNA non-specific endonuclease [Betaproteobacteria bacterium]